MSIKPRFYSRVAAHIFLCILFYIFFGKIAINKYLNGGVIITRNDVLSRNITSPGINKDK